MDLSVILQYGMVLLVLIGLEGILAADNALVMAIMVKHLPEDQRRKALFYGLGGALILRFGSLFVISFLVNIWQVQAVGAIYLIFLSLNHLVKKYLLHKSENHEEDEKSAKKGSGFWMTVVKVEVADIAFAVDSILAAVAIALSLPNTPLPNIGGMDGAKFLTVFFGGFVGVVIMRYAATLFVNLLNSRPGLESTAFIIVGWVGAKLGIITLAHPAVGILPEGLPESTGFKIMFWGIFALIGIVGWILSGKTGKTAKNSNDQEQAVAKTA